jgi:hypothetical protein
MLPKEKKKETKRKIRVGNKVIGLKCIIAHPNILKSRMKECVKRHYCNKLVEIGSQGWKAARVYECRSFV